jgi:hypothetical protein
MIARLDNLRKQPVVFRHLTGLSVAVFDALAADVVPAVEAAHRKKLARPDRRRAIGSPTCPIRSRVGGRTSSCSRRRG